MPQSQAYSPTAEQPYQPYQAPEPQQPVVPEYVKQPGYQFTGAPTTKVGAVAGVLDNIFRGYMRGRVEGDMKKAIDIKRKTDNLQNSYNQDAELLYKMAQSGTDPNSPEYKQAVSAVQGSWDALHDWVGQHVNGEQTKKGKKTKSAQQAQSDPLADLKSEDPNVRAQALYALQKKMGPPILWQIKQFQTPEAQAARQASQMGAENSLRHQQAQKDYDDLAGKPPDQLTDAEKTKLANSRAILFPPRQTGAAYLYRRTNEKGETEQQRFREDEVPEGEGWQAVGGSSGAKKLYKSPDGKPNEQGRTEEYYAPGEAPQGWTPETKTSGPKEGSFGSFLIKQFGDKPTGEQYLQGRKMWAAAGHVPGSGRGGGGADKTYQKWAAYYKEHYPQMSEEERDTLARRKTEGASQMTAGGIGFDAETQPQAFDSDVINQAVENLQRMPQYGGANPTIKNLGDALANIVGIGDNGYAYHNRSYLQEHGPDSNGKFSGDVTEDQLKGLERDLQNQIRIILSKQTGLPPEQKRAAAQRMLPLFTPAANFGPEPAVPKSGTPGASPRPAATPTPAASSPSAAGAHHESLPPEAKKHLKHGEITTFGNGQEWTLDEHGNEQRVK